MRKRKSQTQLLSIGEVLFSILKKRGMTSKIEERKLQKLWPEAVGSQIASQTQPDSLRNGTLFVKTVSSVWVQQLHFMKDDIRRKINELAGKTSVKDIHFTVGYNPQQSPSGRSSDETQKPVLKERDKKMIAQCTQTLADPELAEIVKRVMKKEISRRRLHEEKPTHGTS